MAALSFCSNWPETGYTATAGDFFMSSPLFDAHSEVAEALLGFLDPADSPLFPIDTLFDDQDGDFFSSSSTSPSPPAVDVLGAENSLIPSFSTPSQLHLPAEPQSQENFTFPHHQRFPKRHRSCSDLCLVPQPPPSLFEQSPFVLSSVETAPSPDFGMPAPPAADCGVGLSAQSVAARQRRKRISEKTQELGRLIPGGTKMNTAEMLQSAHKYVRFLQAQIGILGLMGSLQVGGEAAEGEEQLQRLLTSPAVQERLYAEGRCIVPKQVVNGLAADSQLRSSPVISRELDRLTEYLAKKIEDKQ